MAGRLKNHLFALLVFLVLEVAIAMIDYCKNNTFTHSKNSEELIFSKENSDEEFGIYDKFKCLHCCSHGYRSIEWFKDGKPYPWSTDVSTLIIYPESRNQTIYSQQLTTEDAGKYWCVVRNDTHVIQHEVLLKVFGPSISMGWPKTTYRPRDQKAAFGEFVRFYCEAFVGTIDLPDFQSEIIWERYDSNKSFIDDVSVVQQNIFREEKRVIGSYLSFTAVRPIDYGEYKCKVKNLGDQVVELSAWLKHKEGNEITEIPIYSSKKISFAICEFYIIAIFLFLSAIASTITFLYFGSHFRFWNKRNFHKCFSSEDCKKDLLIVYHESDVGDTLNVLLTTIRNKNRYSCSLHPLRNRLEIGAEELKAKANSFKGVFVVMTPELAGGYLTARTIHSTVQFLIKGLPVVNKSEENLLQDALSRVHYIEGTKENNLKFWEWIRQKLCGKKRKVGTIGSLEELI